MCVRARARVSWVTLGTLVGASVRFCVLWRACLYVLTCTVGRSVYTLGRSIRPSVWHHLRVHACVRSSGFVRYLGECV